MIETLPPPWPTMLAVVQITLAAVASGHVVLHKREVGSAIGWIGLVWLVPFAGAGLYALFGVNRIRRRATDLRARRTPPAATSRPRGPAPQPGSAPADFSPPTSGMSAVAALIDRITDRRVLPGNIVEPLEGGERAYAAMLDAIEGAQAGIGLTTYVFDHDAAGSRFVDALARACARGVAVRVLIDGVGARYSVPSIMRALGESSIPAREFLPSLFPWSIHYANLRNHRKILVVDGRTAFAGGMNIRTGHVATSGPSAIQDLHFRLDGPVVAHLAETFADDWAFVCGEILSGEAWFPPLPEQGTTAARGIAAGPDEAFERIRWAILGALAAARSRVRIVTPYFLPDRVLSTALQLASMRGVQVDIVLPRRCNLRLVQWASGARISSFVARGCRIWRTPPPFDHTKLMTVDGLWSLFGSANWDSRSFRLNFELDVECYDAGLAAALDGLIDRKIAGAELLTMSRLRRRPLHRRLRDGAAWLLSPYL